MLKPLPLVDIELFEVLSWPLAARDPVPTSKGLGPYREKASQPEKNGLLPCKRSMSRLLGESGDIERDRDAEQQGFQDTLKISRPT